MRTYHKSLEYMRVGRKYLFEATHYAEPVLCSGIGSKVYDVDGNEYLDLNAGQFCVTFGHNYAPFSELIGKQLSRIYHTNTGMLTPEVFKAAEDVAEINSGDLQKTIFLSTGSEANECALRFAKAYSQRTGVLSFDKGYHGLTLASQGSTMGGQWALPLVPDTYAVMTPDIYHRDRKLTEAEFLDMCINDLQSKFERFGNELAAVILEPVIGVGGMIPVPGAYLKIVRELCDQYDVVLIFDECQCGFGRCGEWFVYQDVDVIPDIVTMAKAMGMGMAVSAVTFSKRVADKVEFGLTHFSSHQNDPLAAAITSFVIEEIRKNDLLASNVKKGEYLLKSLERVCKETEFLVNPRGKGLMCGFDLNDTVFTDYRKTSMAFIEAMQENGVLIQAVRQGRTFRVMPNYYMLEAEIDMFCEACVKSAKCLR